MVPNNSFMNAFIIGRFQPLHAGHIDIIHYAQQKYARCLIIIGSTNSGLSHNNPIPTLEIQNMLRQVTDIPIVYASDFLQNAQWVANIKNIVSTYFDGQDATLVTCSKDIKPNHYYKNFTKVDVFPIALNVSATNIRQSILDGDKHDEHLPQCVKSYIDNNYQAIKTHIHSLMNQQKYMMKSAPVMYFVITYNDCNDEYNNECNNECILLSSDDLGIASMPCHALQNGQIMQEIENIITQNIQFKLLGKYFYDVQHSIHVADTRIAHYILHIHVNNMQSIQDIVQNITYINAANDNKKNYIWIKKDAIPQLQYPQHQILQDVLFNNGQGAYIKNICSSINDQANQ